MDDAFNIEEANLGQLIAQGNEPAFRKLFEGYKNRLFGYVLAITHSHRDAEEITQELFIKLWESRHLLAQVENLDSYLFVMARLRTLSYLRASLREEQGLQQLALRMQPAPPSDPALRLIESAYADLLNRAVKGLSPQRKLVYQLSRDEHLSLEEIAARLNLSRNTVKNHLVEALRQLREQFTSRDLGMLLLFMILVE